ncbi:MAG: hypothetical protein ACYC7F_02250 [Gemmatimonadaceae bacterium]
MELRPRQRRIVPLIVLLLGFAFSWPLITGLLRLLGVIRGEIGGFFDPFIELAAAYAAGLAGIHATRRLAAPVDEVFLKRAFGILIVVLSIWTLGMMLSVSTRAHWSIVDWANTLAAPLGALLALSELNGALQPNAEGDVRAGA